MINFLNQSQNEDSGVKEIAQKVIDLTTLTPESIPPVPSNLVARPQSAQLSYLKTCLLNWKSEKTEQIDWDKLGFETSDDFVFLLSLMESSFPYDSLSSWITSKSNFGALSKRDERNYARRYVCMAISERLSGKSIDSMQAHTDVAECVQKVRFYNDSGESNSSPFYFSVITPFLKELKRIITSECNVRGILPGDENLRLLYSNYED